MRITPPARSAVPLSHCRRNIWILKPDHSWAGRGIEVFDSSADIASHLDAVFAAGKVIDARKTVAADSSWVVQKYVERPLLLNGRKFDIRINVLVSDEWDIYVFRDGICRTSSAEYDSGGGAGAVDGGGAGSSSSSSALNKTVHVTNNAFQIKDPDFQRYEPGNILSLDQLQTYLDGAYGPGFVSVRADLFPRWVELILDVLSAARARAVLGSGPRRFFDSAWQ